MIGKEITQNNARKVTHSDTLFFFFSSRRRHTRLQGDWSSDVCSSDLQTKAPKIQRLVTPLVLQRKRHRLAIKKRRVEKSKAEAAEYEKLLAQRKKESQIGRASCRERV